MSIKKQKLSTVKNKAWDIFSWFIRLRDWDEQGRQYITTDDGSKRSAFCITCTRSYPIEGHGCLQAGHLLPGRNNQVLFDEKIVHAQCYHCNHHLRGNWPRYYEKMVIKYGQDEVNKMIAESKLFRKYTIPELEEMIVDWKQRIAILEELV